MPHDTSRTAADIDTAGLEADLVALVGSRLCHDLISPLGAIGNGVELLAMSGMGASPEVQLIAEAVTAANARIRFFRIAFGQAGADQRLSENEILAVLDEISRGGRMKVHWLGSGDQSRRLMKLLFLGLLCLEPALPWGGEVEIRETGGEWCLAARAKRTRPDPELWSRLSGSLVPVAPAQVQFALLPREAGHQGRRIAWKVSDTGAEIRF